MKADRQPECIDIQQGYDTQHRPAYWVEVYDPIHSLYYHYNRQKLSNMGQSLA